MAQGASETIENSMVLKGSRLGGSFGLRPGAEVVPGRRWDPPGGHFGVSGVPFCTKSGPRSGLRDPPGPSVLQKKLTSGTQIERNMDFLVRKRTQRGCSGEQTLSVALFRLNGTWIFGEANERSADFL